MPVASTSKLAFKKKQKSLGREQLVVYNAVKKLQPATDLEVSDYLGVPISSISARRYELVKYGYVKEDGRRYNRTGNSAKAWVAVNPSFEKIVKIIKGETDSFREVADCN